MGTQQPRPNPVYPNGAMRLLLSIRTQPGSTVSLDVRRGRHPLPAPWLDRDRRAPHLGTVATTARTAFLREQIRTGCTTLWRACEIVPVRLASLMTTWPIRWRVPPLPQTRDGAGLSGALFRQRLRRALLAADADQATRRRAARQRISNTQRAEE